MQLAMRRNFGVLAALTAVVLLIGSMPLAAQTCTPNTNTGVTVDVNRSNLQSPIQNMNWHAQTFTVLGSGCFTLNQVTFSARKSGSPGDLVVEIYNATADTPAIPFGLPGGSAAPLASATVPAASVSTGYTDLTVTFSSPPQITGGAQYALVIHQAAGSGQNFYNFGLDDGNPYPNFPIGGRFCKSSSTPVPPSTTWDCPSGPGGGLDVRMSICVSPCVSGCTLTQGFWKNHGGRGPQPNAWPVSSLTLGTHSYTQSELLDILEQSVNGNGLVSLAHQLIAAKLNIANGASAPSGVLAAIASADAMIGSLIVPPVGSGFLDPSVTSALTTTLDMYNNGVFAGGPPHCE